MNTFGLIFDIIKTVKALPLVLNKKSGSSISDIMGILYDVSKEKDVEKIWERLQNDNRLRDKVIEKITKISLQKEKISYANMTSARKRDLKIRRSAGYNLRADMMIFMSWIAIIFLIFSILYFRSTLNSDMILIFSSVISFLGSMIADAHFFEFGGTRQKQKNR